MTRDEIRALVEDVQEGTLCQDDAVDALHRKMVEAQIAELERAKENCEEEALRIWIFHRIAELQKDLK